MIAKLIILTVLFLTIEKSGARAHKSKNKNKYTCSQTDSTMFHCNNSKIEVAKNSENYYIRLCSNTFNNCKSDMNGYNLIKIECSKIDQAFEQLTGGM